MSTFCYAPQTACSCDRVRSDLPERVGASADLAVRLEQLAQTMPETVTVPAKTMMLLLARLMRVCPTAFPSSTLGELRAEPARYEQELGRKRGPE
jgi:hypothetical protein